MYNIYIYRISADIFKNNHKLQQDLSSKTYPYNPSTLATTSTNPQMNYYDNKTNAITSSPPNSSKLKITNLSSIHKHTNNNNNNNSSSMIIKSKSSNNIKHNNNTNNSNTNNNSSKAQLTQQQYKTTIQEFLSKQAAIIEEMSSMKDDIQFILENRSKSKLKDKLNQSIISSSMNNSHQSSANQSQNNSIIHSSSNNVSYYTSNNNNLNESSLNCSVISCVSHTNVRRKFNIKDKFILEDNLTDFLNNYNQYKNILFLVDNKGNIWELIKRIDLNINIITNNPSSLKSIVFCEKIQDTNLSNIEIKDPFENRSAFETTEDEFGKFSEFNLSKYIKESD